MRNQNTGQIRVVEAFLAVAIVFSAFTVSASLTVSQNKNDRDDLTSVGLQALIKLDSDGSLGDCLTKRNWTRLRESLNLALPVGITFNLTVYDEQMRQINEAAISNGAFSSQNTESLEYVCIDQGATFHSYIIYLDIAVGA